MSELKFKVGDVVADETGIIGTIMSTSAGARFPYRIREEFGGGSGMYEESADMRLVFTEDAPTADPVSRPSHYTKGMPAGMEVIDVIEAQERVGGNNNHSQAIKYLLRALLKGNTLQDYQKAEFYIQREIQKREAGQ